MAAKEGLKNLAQYSDTTNASISTLYSDLITLKNAFAVAFAAYFECGNSNSGYLYYLFNRCGKCGGTVLFSTYRKSNLD